MNENIPDDEQGMFPNAPGRPNEISGGNISLNWFDELGPEEDQGNNSLILNVFNEFSPDSSAAFITSDLEGNKALLNKIQSWLFETFGEIPPFEDDPKIIEHLIKVYEHHIWLTETHESLEYCAKVQSSEYEVEGDRLRRELEVAGVDLESLSEITSDCLDELASKALFLGAKDTEKSSLQSALIAYQDEIYRIKEKISKFERGTSRLIKQISQMQENTVALRRSLQNIEIQGDEIIHKTAQRNSEIQLLIAKAEEYRENIDSLEDQWINGSVEKEHLRLEELMRLERDIQEHQRVFTALKIELQSYNELPLDLMLAKLKFAETQNEMDRLQRIKDELIFNIIPRNG